ncbi:cupin domain-containing protein [Streptomyces sp. MB09-01]|uniref:cupin domain-containing protein n=1 Tax=Streptomyces sp. MB09-01 TaxID=3028666 RepID=UPI0029AE0129|nr:cupin domain-containing protein [Streptomyces sp. MB09-01]MDX3536325.1 cupin domain-containing protein [Streptomyces sp. MB09-01]
MTLVNLFDAASRMPAAWCSEVLGEIGTASVKLLRMDGAPVVEESHGSAEILIVLDGRLELVVQGAPVAVGPGEMCRIPAGVHHEVRPGSSGTLLIVEVPEG